MDSVKNIIAVVGMCGSGKSVACEYFVSQNWSELHFGAITIEELNKKKLPINSDNEKRIRETLRKQHGMEVYAKLSLPRIKDLLARQQKVVINGLYSWDEYVLLNKHFKDDLLLLEIYTNKSLRYKRLTTRTTRALTCAEAEARDRAEIENLSKGGPIAFSDYKIANNDGKKELHKKLRTFLQQQLFDKRQLAISCFEINFTPL